jgi:cholest-4-en-3-one 26-monooxygenase
MALAFRFDNPDNYVTGTPYDEFARLRRETPFAWNVRSSDPTDGFWLVTRHEDICAISKNPAQFATHSPLLQDPLPKALWPDFPAAAMIANNLLTFEHTKHASFRSLVNALLSPSSVALMETRIRTVCGEVLARTADRSRFDFAKEVALALPVDVVLGIVLGIPREHHEKLARCILAINAMEDPMFCPPPGGMFAAADELFAYGKSHAARLQESPDSSLLGELVATGQFEELTKEQLLFAFWFPLTAGAFDTTAATLAGGVQALLAHPDEAERLQADPRLLPLAVEEMIRWVSPVIYFRRSATEDTVFRGHRIRQGDKLLLCYASGNRDEYAFADPDRFDVGRTPNRHVSFGYGPHFCLGAPLARATTRIFLEEFVSQLGSLELDGDVRRTRSAWMNRIWSMPVRRSRPYASSQ